MTIHGELVIHTDKCSEKALEKAQKYLDQEVIRTCAPYVPLDTGTLERSGKMSSDIGSGTVTWNTPYAKKQYYEGKSKGLRGARWFDRAKADHAEDWQDGVAKILGGENDSNH